MDEVRVGGPGGTVIFRCARRLPNGAAELLSVTLQDSDLNAGRGVYEGYADGFGPLADFFRDLAEHWRGWDGERTYESIEHDLRIVATHDGHLRLKVRLWQSTDPDGWTADIRVRLDPREHEPGLARR